MYAISSPCACSSSPRVLATFIYANIFFILAIIMVDKRGELPCFRTYLFSSINKLFLYNTHTTLCNLILNQMLLLDKFDEERSKLASKIF